MAYVAALGQACPDCAIWNGAACVPCPDGATDAECAGCIAGERPGGTFWQEYGTSIMVGAVGSVVAALATAWALRRARLE